MTSVDSQTKTEAMPDFVIHCETARLEMTGTAFMVYANRYRGAAIGLLSISASTRDFDPVPYFLLCQSLELHLKSFKGKSVQLRKTRQAAL